MADIVVYNNAKDNQNDVSPRRQVFTTSLIGYEFFVDITTFDLVYVSTTNGGASWGGATTVRAGAVEGFDVWFDKWTPGGTGTVIHTAYIDSGSDAVFYRGLDTNGDSLGAETTIFSGLTAGINGAYVSIAKSRGSSLYCNFDIDIGTEQGFAVSDDAGGTWSPLTGPGEGAGDLFMLFPGNEADNQDMWLLFWDISANEISLKTYDDSGDTWSEASISLTMTDQSPIANEGLGMSGSIRLSDNHLIMVAWTTLGVGADLKCWDINGAASITAKTDVITDSANSYHCAVCIDQSTDDLYISYLGKADGSETYQTSVGTYYKISGDGGQTWDAEQTIAQTTGTLAKLGCNLGGSDGRFYPTWEGAAADVFGNFVNSLVFGGSAPSGEGLVTFVGGFQL